MEKLTNFRADHEAKFMIGAAYGRSVGRSVVASMIAVSCDSQTQ
jgi:hypothetical protein